jgi:hypothetical protein
MLTAVDGRVVQTLSKIAEAAYLKNVRGESQSAWRLHTHFDVERGVPTHIEVTSGKNSGASDEKSVLRKNLTADHCYIMDRWYAQFALFAEIQAIGSSSVCQVRDNSRYEILAMHSLSQAAIAAGAVGDQRVNLGAPTERFQRPDHPVQLVEVRITPSQPRGKTAGGKTGPPSDGILRIATNLLEVPAEIIAEVYKHRLDDRAILSLFQACAGLSAPAEHVAPGRGDSSLRCDHRLPVVGAADRRQTDLANSRNGLPLPARLGGRRRTARPSKKTQARAGLEPLPPSDVPPVAARHKF